MKIKLIKTWKESYKYLSVQSVAVLALVAGLYPYLPMLQEYLPPSALPFAAVAVILARVIDQGRAD